MKYWNIFVEGFYRGLKGNIQNIGIGRLKPIREIKVQRSKILFLL